MISMGYCKDESATWEKIAWQPGKSHKSKLSAILAVVIVIFPKLHSFM